MAVAGAGAGAPKPVVKPSTPKFGLDVTSFVDDTHINIRIRTSKDSTPCALGVIIFQNHKQVLATDTDAIGFLEHKVPYVQTAKKQIFSFEVFLKDSTEKGYVEVEIPEKAAPVAGAIKSDPQKIILIRTSDGKGHFKVFIRVIKAHGYGLLLNVDVIFNNTKYVVKTDKRGIGEFIVPGVIAPGADLPLQAIVSGIEDHARIRITRPKRRGKRRKKFSAAWFFKTNNGRAFLLMCTAAVFWVWAICIGVGQPLFHQNWFRNDDGFSKQELVYNQVMEQAFPEQTHPIRPTEVSGHWHHWIWKAAFILTLIFLIYGPLSLREEIAEEFGLVVERLRDRDYVQAGDPWFEKLVAWSGAYAVARHKEPVVTSTDSSTPAPTRKGPMWSEFPVHLVSDAVVEFVPAIFRAMFK
ncbi:MAG: hypothetical protein WCT50_00705 [Patescibacteria group bacterium]